MDQAPEPPMDQGPEPTGPEGPDPDLERIARDLADVEHALDRLGDGSYWTDEVTGEPIPDEALADDPTSRRAAYVPTEPTGPGDPPPDA